MIVLPSSIETVVIPPIFIPGGLIEAGDKLQWILGAEDSGTTSANARTHKIQISNSIDFTAAVPLSTVLVQTASNTRMSVDKAISILSSTAIRVGNSIVGTGSTNTLAGATINVPNLSNDTYIRSTIANSNTLVNHTLYYFTLYLEKGT